MPKLSVIVTAYNIEKYIAECLESVVGQTLDDIEIIVVDDGSSDGTVEIIRNFAAQDRRIRTVLFEKNTIGGVASAANAGLDIATGDYVGFADGDDICDTDMFRKLYEAAVQADADLSMCHYQLLDERTGETADPADSHRWSEIAGPTIWELDTRHRKQLLQFIAVPWRKIYRREMLEAAKIRFPVGDYFFEDNPFHWFSVLSANRVALLPEILCYHRVARIGQTMATVDDRLLKIFEHEQTIRAWLKANNHDEEYAADLLGWISAQLSWVSLRTEGEMQRKLFDKLAPIVQSYPDAAIAASKGTSHRVNSMIDALRRKDFVAFSRAAGYRVPEKSLFALGMYHLRHAGVRNTAVTTARFLRSRFARRSAAHSGGRNAPEQGNLSQQLSDIHFALIILQRRLDQMETELRLLRQDAAPIPNRNEN